MTKSKLLVASLFVLMLVIVGVFLSRNKPSQEKTPITAASSSPGRSSGSPRLLSTTPPSLDGSVILPNQTLELQFNYPIENRGELKQKIDPQPAEYKVELTPDRKTAKIIPTKPFSLGTSYTIFITKEAKFDGGKRLEGDIILHFKTISYQGV